MIKNVFVNSRILCKFTDPILCHSPGTSSQDFDVEFIVPEAAVKQTFLQIFSCLPCQSFQAFLDCFVITALKPLHTSHNADAATSLVTYNAVRQSEFACSCKPAVLLHSDTSESGKILKSRTRKPPSTRCPCPSASRVMMLSGNTSSTSFVSALDLGMGQQKRCCSSERNRR